MNWIIVILSGALFVSCVLIRPKTLFSRGDQPSETVEPAVFPEKLVPSAQMVENISSSLLNLQVFPYHKYLGMRAYHREFLKHLLGPFFALRLLGVLLVMFWYAGLVSGVVDISDVGQ